MQQVVQQGILPTEAVVTPEGLDAQQVHGEDLANHAFVSGADGISRLWHPQQAGVLQQPGVHGFQGRQQVAAVGGAGQDHHHESAAEDPNDDFADARLSDHPKFVAVADVNHRKRDDGAGIAGKLKGVGHVVGEQRAGPGAQRQPAGNTEQKQPGIVQRMARQQQGGAGAEQAAGDAAKAFTDHAADGGKADHCRGGHRPVRLIEIQRVGDA